MYGRDGALPDEWMLALGLTSPLTETEEWVLAGYGIFPKSHYLPVSWYGDAKYRYCYMMLAYSVPQDAELVVHLVDPALLTPSPTGHLYLSWCFDLFSGANRWDIRKGEYHRIPFFSMIPTLISVFGANLIEPDSSSWSTKACIPHFNKPFPTDFSIPNVMIATNELLIDGNTYHMIRSD